MIPERIKRIINDDPFYTRCIHSYRKDHQCDSSPTMEHAHYYAGRQIQKWWSILPCCQSMNNDVHGLDKKYNQWVAFQRASASDILAYPCKDWLTPARYLNTLFEMTPGLSLAIQREREYLIQIGFKRANEVFNWWVPEVIEQICEVDDEN